MDVISVSVVLAEVAVVEVKGSHELRLDGIGGVCGGLAGAGVAARQPENGAHPDLPAGHCGLVCGQCSWPSG